LSQKLIIFLGPPGAGKGTQAERYTNHKSLAHVSTGVMLREHVERNTNLGVTAKGILDKGDLVPDELVISMLKERLGEEDALKGAVLDGFPRTILQAESLDELHNRSEIVAVVVFKVEEKILIQRMLERGRSDDNEETVKQRIEVYKKDAELLITFYKEKNIININGVGEEDEIFDELTNKLSFFVQ